MNVFLENNYFRVKIDLLGAELHSVISKKTNTELIWQANPEIWARHAPVLFPIVGKLKNNTFNYQDKSYSLPQHGFARDMNFECLGFHDTKAVLQLTSNRETRAVFPFDFTLLITYELKLNALNCTYTVVNTGNDTMFFSIGAHPGFNCPIDSSEKWEDITLNFPQREEGLRLLLTNGLLTGEKKKGIDSSNQIVFSKETFNEDAIVFYGLNSSEVTLSSKKYQLRFYWKNMDYLGIWAKKDVYQYVCIEPWAGVADYINATGEISEKTGIQQLGPNNKFECSFGFEFDDLNS